MENIQSQNIQRKILNPNKGQTTKVGLDIDG